MSRNADNLEKLVDELKQNNIEASYYVADVYRKDEIVKALAAIKAKYGQIDVLEFSPTVGHYPPTSVLELTSENARDQFEGYIVSAIETVNAVLPDMLSRQAGALLFTTGLSAMYPITMMGNIGIALAGLRSYVANLHTELAPKGVFAAHRSLGLFIKEAGTGEVTDPDVIAEMWYQAYADKNVAEDVYPAGVTPATIIF